MKKKEAMEMSGVEGRGNGDEGCEDDVGAKSEEWRKTERGSGTDDEGRSKGQDRREMARV